MAPTTCPYTSSKHNQSQYGHSKTPTSRHRLLFGASKSPNPNTLVKEIPPAEHPVEVVGRIRDFPDRKDKSVSALQISPDLQTVRLRADFGYRDFSLDGISLSEEEDLEGFYRKFVASRIQGVKLGYKCTVMMYGPTGSGKSHTMFGYSKVPGIVYRSLKDILGETCEEDEQQTFVQVTVLEIYNEEIYDLLSSNGGGGLGLACSKGIGSKARLEVIGKKAKNASSIIGNEAAKISKEIEKVEKRRTVKSTLCNERSSRSHCLIILDVPKVGGRLMLVDMAGSENIEQAGQAGLEAKLQTAKINQGNIALKRVVESIANGDSHVPFRDSKLTMLLQDSFEDDKSKILMILCASPDPKEIHKTISTLEYGAKAKCIVRGLETSNKEKNGLEDASIFLNSRIAVMDQFIRKLQMEKKQKERECIEAQEHILKKDEETALLKTKLERIAGGWKGNEEEIDLKVSERTKSLKSEMERKLNQCQKMATDFVQLGKKRMEEKIVEQEKEIDILRKRLEEIESLLCGSCDEDVVGRRFMNRLLENQVDNDAGMVKSMDLDVGDDIDVKCEDHPNQASINYKTLEEHDIPAPKYSSRVGLSTVYEEEEEGDEDEEYRDSTRDGTDIEEVKKEVIEEKTVYSNSPSQRFTVKEEENGKESEVSASFRRKRIENIHTLCGIYRELSQHISTPIPPRRSSGIRQKSGAKLFTDENSPPQQTKFSPAPCGLVKMLLTSPCYQPEQAWQKDVDRAQLPLQDVTKSEGRD